MKYFSAQFDAGMFTRDKVMAKRINSDPLELRAFTAKFYQSILKAMIFVGMMPWRIRLPVFEILGGNDLMVDAKAGEKYFRKIRSRDKTLKWYPEMYHALYVDKDREQVFRDIVDWVGEKLREEREMEHVKERTNRRRSSCTRSAHAFGAKRPNKC